MTGTEKLAHAMGLSLRYSMLIGIAYWCVKTYTFVTGSGALTL